MLRVDLPRTYSENLDRKVGNDHCFDAGNTMG